MNRKGIYPIIANDSNNYNAGLKFTLACLVKQLYVCYFTSISEDQLGFLFI